MIEQNHGEMDADAEDRHGSETVLPDVFDELLERLSAGAADRQRSGGSLAG